MELRAAAPDYWIGFVGMMIEVAEDARRDMLSCDPSMLQRAQGMALALDDIAKTLEQAPQHMDKLRAGQIGKRHG
jgi:hypothetical protein